MSEQQGPFERIQAAREMGRRVKEGWRDVAKAIGLTAKSEFIAQKLESGDVDSIVADKIVRRLQKLQNRFNEERGNPEKQSEIADEFGLATDYFADLLNVENLSKDERMKSAREKVIQLMDKRMKETRYPDSDTFTKEEEDILRSGKPIPRSTRTNNAYFEVIDQIALLPDELRELERSIMRTYD